MTDDLDELKRNMPYSAREKVESWLTSNPRQYFRAADLAEALHLHPGTVRKVLQDLRADGWEVEQWGSGRTTHQRYLRQGAGQGTMVTTTREELQAEYERLRAVMIEIHMLAAGVVPGNTGAAWRALESIEYMAEQALAAPSGQAADHD